MSKPERIEISGEVYALEANPFAVEQTWVYKPGAPASGVGHLKQIRNEDPWHWAYKVANGGIWVHVPPRNNKAVSDRMWALIDLVNAWKASQKIKTSETSQEFPFTGPYDIEWDDGSMPTRVGVVTLKTGDLRNIGTVRRLALGSYAASTLEGRRLGTYPGMDGLQRALEALHEAYAKAHGLAYPSPTYAQGDPVVTPAMQSTIDMVMADEEAKTQSSELPSHVKWKVLGQEMAVGEVIAYATEPVYLIHDEETDQDILVPASQCTPYTPDPEKSEDEKITVKAVNRAGGWKR